MAKHALGAAIRADKAKRDVRCVLLVSPAPLKVRRIKKKCRQYDTRGNVVL